MNKKLLLPAIVSLLVLAGISVYFYNARDNSKKESDNQNILKENSLVVNTVTNEIVKVESSNTAANNTNTANNSNQNDNNITTKVVTAESGFIDYDESKLTNAQYGRVVLFFHASWCPSCRGLEKDIINNKNNIPADLLIMKVDYDSSTDLKKKYKVVQQHTLVQVDSKGELIKSNQGLYQLNTLESLNNTFKK